MSSVCGYCLCKDGHMGPCPHQEIERLRAENSHWKSVTGFATPEELVAAVDERFRGNLPPGLARSLWILERKENARLREILQFDRFSHNVHRPSYALNCLYEGEITIAKFCEWMEAYVAGRDEPLPDVPFASCGQEKAPKELQAENALLREALEQIWRAVKNGPCVDGDYSAQITCVKEVYSALRAALAGKEQG